MSEQNGFAVWITGIPASGKSSVTRALVQLLRERGLPVVVLESDALRRVLTPEPRYTDEERNRFYGQMLMIGELICSSGVNVVFDATANRRAYRDQARKRFKRFAEVYVECPLDVCMQRDPKGIYARAALRQASSVPGLQAAYEPPLKPDAVVDGRADPGKNAAFIEEVIGRLFSL